MSSNTWSALCSYIQFHLGCNFVFRFYPSLLHRPTYMHKLDPSSAREYGQKEQNILLGRVQTHDPWICSQTCPIVLDFTKIPNLRFNSNKSGGGGITPKGSYSAKTGDNDCNVNSSRYSLSTALCESNSLSGQI